jgi:ESS family glutamate:Na+ symporter
MEDTFVFDPFLAFSLIGAFLVVGVLLRAKVRFFQSFLLPSCLIGGTFGTIFINLRLIDLPFSYFETIAYHFMNIGFISIGLTQNNSNSAEQGNRKKLLRGSFWMVLMKGVTFPLQALIGLSLMLIFNAVGYKLFPTFGLFLPLGYVEGPGQALSIANIYKSFGFQHATSIGLMFAIMGYVFCFFLGMPLIRAGLRKGSGKQDLPDHFLKGILPEKEKADSEGAARKTLYSENVDNLAYQFGLIGVVYLITYSFCYGISLLLPPGTEKIIWGIFFGIGLAIAVLFTKVMKKLGVAHLVDPGLQHHVTGFSLDFMIVATLMAIQTTVIWQYFIPILAISLAGGIVTLLSILYFGKRQKDLALERTVFVYGTYTGAMSTGLLLLRIVDPNFSSDVLKELAIYPFLVFPFTIGFIVLTTGQVSWGWGIGQTMGIFGAILIISLILLKVMNYWGKPGDIFGETQSDSSMVGKLQQPEN